MPIKSRDFSRPPGGRRLRVALHHYEPEHRQFRHVKGIGALVNVRNLAEQKRLWRAVEEAIERGDWREDAGTPDSPDAATDTAAPGSVGTVS